MTVTVGETRILIVGGALAGLSLACLLAKHNTKCVVLEKQLDSSPHPRAVGFTSRTMEIISVMGIADKTPQTTADFRLRRVQVESLAGKWGDKLDQPSNHGGSSIASYSAYLDGSITQDKLEPILRERAIELGCDIRLCHCMLDFDYNTSDERIMVRVRSNTDTEYTISTEYLVAADGHRSAVRNTLQIPTSGHGFLHTLTSVLFRAPSLDKYLKSGFHQFRIRHPGGLTGFLTPYDDSRWVLMFLDGKQRTEQELGEAILQATGEPHLKYMILTTGTWDLEARIAESFAHPAEVQSNPNMFLIGDAAHTLPPTRGRYGANTGIGNAHNLAWKLASVVGERSKPELLRSYDTERRPVAWVRHNQTFAGPDYASYKQDGKDYGKLRDPLAVELGQVYESDIIVGGEENDDTVPITMQPAELKGQPGSRAPHIVLLGQYLIECSSLCFFGTDWTLMCHRPKWINVSQEVSKRSRIAL